MCRAGVESLARVKGEASSRRETNTHRQSKVLSFDVWESQELERTLEIHLMQQPSLPPLLPVQASFKGSASWCLLQSSCYWEQQNQAPNRNPSYTSLTVTFCLLFWAVQVCGENFSWTYWIWRHCVSCRVDYNDWNSRRFEKASLSTTICSVLLSAQTKPVPDSWIRYKHPN